MNANISVSLTKTAGKNGCCLSGKFYNLQKFHIQIGRKSVNIVAVDYSLHQILRRKERICFEFIK